MSKDSSASNSILNAVMLLLFGGAMIAITIVAAVVMLGIMQQLLFSMVGIGPMADAIRAFASVVTFLVMLWIVLAMESEDGTSSRSYETSSSSSEDYYIDTEEASESLDRIEDELN